MNTKDQNNTSKKESMVEVDVIDNPTSHSIPNDGSPEPDQEEEEFDENAKYSVKRPPEDKMDQYATFFPRGAWDANPDQCPDSIPTDQNPVTSIVLCWTDTEDCKTEKDCKERVRQVQAAHIQFRKLPDIKFHYLVGGDGSLYEGRGWHKKAEDFPLEAGADAAKLNSSHMIQVGLIGMPDQAPNHSQLEVLSTVVTLGQEENWLTTAFSLYWYSDSKLQYYKTYDASDEIPDMLPPRSSPF